MDLASRARIAKALQNGSLMDWQKRAQEAKKTGQNDLFGSQNELPPLVLEETEPWTKEQALEEERKAIGFYLSGHPLDWLEPHRDLADAISKNNAKYGSHLLNRPKHTTGGRRNGYKSR